ncbi:hypothetical protein LINPERHAP2_LOCUS32681 [Linum perenne]
MNADSQVDSGSKFRKHICWTPAPDGWAIVNTDIFVLQHSNQAAAGGIIRDWRGHRLAVFSANLGSCTIIRAELGG